MTQYLSQHQSRAMVCVWLDVHPQYEEEFNDWYELEHVSDIVSLEGFISGRRYFSEKAQLRYLVLYEAVDEHVEPGPHFQRVVAKPTPWTTRVRKLFGERRRRLNLSLILDSGVCTEPGAIVTIESKGSVTPSNGEQRMSQATGCLRYRGYHEADKKNTRFEIFDFSSHEQALVAALDWELDSSLEIIVRKAIGTPVFHNK